MQTGRAVASVIFLSLALPAQEVRDDGPACQDVSTDSRYVGKEVTLYGRLRAFRVTDAGAKHLVAIYTCETKEGKPSPDVALSFDTAEARYAPAAAGSRRQEVVQRVTGVVTRAVSTIRLEKVKVDVAEGADRGGAEK